MKTILACWRFSHHMLVDHFFIIINGYQSICFTWECLYQSFYFNRGRMAIWPKNEDEDEDGDGIGDGDGERDLIYSGDLIGTFNYVFRFIS